MSYHKVKKYSYIVGILILISITILFSDFIFFYHGCVKYRPEELQEFRCIDLPQNIMVTFFTEKEGGRNKIVEKAFGEVWYQYYKSVLKGIKYFPVMEDTKGEETTMFENSWLLDRNYGGKRFHEGTDIMTSNNQRGYFSVVSMTDGVVEKKGWLEKGGYRLGIRSEAGGYFYYAHLYDYAPDIEEGSLVKAGQVIGTAGDSGYSKIEGTVGNFDVHLHIGIYLDIDGEETSVNPYWILKYLENNNIK